MPRYTVHVRGEWLAVPCKDAQLTVGWLGREAVRRYIKNKPDNGGFASVDDVRFLMRRCKGLGLLDHDDPLEVALEDNEFVEVGEWPNGGSTRSGSVLSSREVGQPSSLLGGGGGCMLAVWVLLSLWGLRFSSKKRGFYPPFTIRPQAPRGGHLESVRLLVRSPEQI